MSRRFTLSVNRPGKPEHVFDVDPGVYSIGSDGDNRIILPHEEVSWRHAVLSVMPEGCHIEDLMTETGTFVGDLRIEGRMALQPGQPVRIGPYSLAVMPEGYKAARKQPPAPAATPPKAAEPAEKKAYSARAQGTFAEEKELAAGDAREREDEERNRLIRRQIHQELLQRLDIKRLAAGHIGEKDLREKALQSIRQIVADVRDRLPGDVQSERLAKEVYDEAMGLGPLEDLLADPQVTEIMVNGPDRIYVEIAGKIQLTNKTFLNDDSVLAIIERIVSPIGRRIDESQPYVDARLQDGSRVNAIIHPLSLTGPCLTIRKFSKKPFTVDDLIAFGTWTEDIAHFIRACVLLRKNIIISGGTGSGKTSLLNVISSFLPPGDRILTIEDSAELRLGQPHVVRLEARPPNIEGRGAIGVRDLVRNALRMRPDRIVVGEVRGGEALDMLQAMNTGHEGSLTTVHANTPRDVISRLETMVLMSGMELPVRAIREQIGAAIHLIVHESRFSDGTRKVNKITEVVGLEGDQITMQDIFEFRQTGLTEGGKVMGALVPTGSVPTFVEDMKVRGISLKPGIFDPRRQVN